MAFSPEDINTRTIEDIKSRVAEILNTPDVETKASTEFDKWRELAKENGDLIEIAALCIAQEMLERGE